ncbi:hypothetical protein ABT084_37000 [Streptomyces sp. NPDC002138]|uniref:hypothetical protein n=1 Tax=Streptomyces sp. NPDC002138 TaxID=3154410 RepID=UPI003317410C
MPPQDPARSVEELLHRVESLYAMPFPEREERAGDGWAGPGHHVAVLAESRDFWEDRSTELVEEAEEAVEAGLAALATLLTERWGPADVVDLRPWCDTGDGPEGAGPVPEPIGILCALAADMRVWRPRGSGRWAALAVGQADPEWPLQLLAAIGENPALPE